MLRFETRISPNLFGKGKERKEKNKIGIALHGSCSHI
jgi:hypothetical protein